MVELRTLSAPFYHAHSGYPSANEQFGFSCLVFLVSSRLWRPFGQSFSLVASYLVFVESSYRRPSFFSRVRSFVVSMGTRSFVDAVYSPYSVSADRIWRGRGMIGFRSEAVAHCSYTIDYQSTGYIVKFV